MPTRAQEFQEVRRKLGFPKPQKPTADERVGELISAEQWLTNRTGASAKAWTRETVQITTVAEQAEYDISAALEEDGNTFGKALYVFRVLEDTNVLPVPHTDFSHELSNQSYEFWLLPTASSEASVVVGWAGEKVAFFREGATVKMRIFPVPLEAGREYQIHFATGNLNWAEFAWSDVPAMPEHSQLRVVQACINLLARTEWEGYTPEQNDRKQEKLAKGLLREFDQYDAEFEQFLRNPQHEPITELGNWWE